MIDRIQLVKEAAERLKTLPLETRINQPLPFEKNKGKREQARQTIQPNHVAYIGKNGVRAMYGTYGHFPNLRTFQETHGMTSVEGDTTGYRKDY